MRAEADVDVQLQPQTLANTGERLRLAYFPDQAPAVLSTAPRLRVLMAAADRTYLVEGGDWSDLETARPVLVPDPTSTYDNGYAGIAGIHRAEGRVFAIYHAEDHVGMPRFSSGVPGYFASVAMATSRDEGSTWTRLGPVITSSRPKSWTRHANQCDRGTGEPSIALDRTGAWLFLYYTDHTRANSDGVNIAMARASTRLPERGPPRFSKFHRGSFSQPGIGGVETPLIRPGGGTCEALSPHVVFVRAIDRYVMILSINDWSDYMARGHPKNSGVHVAFSVDGVTWSTPQTLIPGFTVPLVMQPLFWGATLLVDDPEAAEGWLIYGYSPSWGPQTPRTRPHHLAGRRITFGVRPRKT